MPMNTPAFATAISRRRNELGLTQQEVADAGGPSDTTQRKIEAATETIVSIMTLRKYDSAFQWPAGTASRILTNETAGHSAKRRHGAWELDPQILVDLSLAADNAYDLAQAAEALDTDDDIDTLIDAARDLAEAAEKLTELAQAVAEVGVGGRVHLQILKSKALADPRQIALTGENQGSQPDYDLARRIGETESEWRERSGNDYD